MSEPQPEQDELAKFSEIARMLQQVINPILSHLDPSREFGVTLLVHTTDVLRTTTTSAIATTLLSASEARITLLRTLISSVGNEGVPMEQAFSYVVDEINKLTAAREQKS